MRRYGILVAVFVLLAGAAIRDTFDAWVDATVLPAVLVESSVEVRDRTGALLRVFPVETGRLRLAVSLGDVDPAFVEMLIAYEDRRFRSHPGVDLRAMLRAVGQAALAGRVVSGGSTLTMQVARLLENSGTGRWTGKLRQIRVALALERRLDKDRILELYLSHAPYGGALEGLRAGSLAWFGKEPKPLGPHEAALLVALPQAPESRRPDRHADAAEAALRRVLDRTGSGSDGITAGLPRRVRPMPRLAPHLAGRARAENPLARVHVLTVDGSLQTRMEALARLAVRDQPRGVSAAMVVADHRTGEVLASVGAPDYSDAGGMAGFVDMTRAARSPGSTLKPFVYGLAFDRGLVHPDTLIDDAPVAFGAYAPQNFDGQFRGEVTIRQALRQSLNIPPVLLLNELGPARLVAMLRRGGAQPQLPGAAVPGLAIALGGLGLDVMQIAQLYAALPQGGLAPGLHWRMGGNVTSPGRIHSPASAWHITQILAGVPPPPGSAARPGEIAYKTGTSYGHRDAWAIGFDGRHVVAVWIGRPDGTPVPGAFGGDIAAPVLFEALGHLSDRRTPLPPPPPETLIAATPRLPLPLQRFRPSASVYGTAEGSPVVAFPPDNAQLAKSGDGVALKFRSGALPVTVLVDGVPTITGLRRREAILAIEGPGFARISIIDSAGRSDHVDIRLK